MSGKILVYIDQENGELQKSGLVALQAARELKEKWGHSDIAGLLLGASSKGAAEKLKEYGLSEIYFSESDEFSKYRAVPFSLAFKGAMDASGSTAGVSAANTTGKDFMPRVAAMIDAGQASDIIAVNDDGSIKRPMYAGDVLADVEITSDKKLVTVRTSAFDAAGTAAGGAGEVKELVAIDAPPYSGEVTGFEGSGGDRPELTDAEVVVSGGRAMQSAENFEKYIYPLADALGAAVGASRAAVDSGYAPNDWQVGQTGKIVAPSLYIAIGISGAIQHLAGMKDSSRKI